MFRFLQPLFWGALSFVLLFVALAAAPCFCASQQDSPPSFFGWKQLFYQWAPHTGKEDLDQSFSKESGSDKAVTYSPPPQSGITPSGREPSVKSPAPTTQAVAPKGNQPPTPPSLMQMEFTEYVNPLLNNFGPPEYYSIPFRHTMPDPAMPIGMNPQSFQDAPYMNGATPASDLVQHAIRLAASQRTAEKILDPSLPSAQASYQGGVQQTADAASMDSAGAFDANLNGSSSPLINVANEMAATPAQANSNRTISQAVWIVQQMFKQFFLPFGLLLLLVGAVATQTTTFVKYSFTDTSEAQNRRPLEGILRAVVAVFLIGGIQLTVSYFIDFGNAMTDPIKNAIDVGTLQSWAQQIADPALNMTPAQVDARNLNESVAAATTRAIFGSVQALLNTALLVLSVYQLIMVCYLFLMGPIAAAMFAWPDVGSLSRSMFPNWLNGLSNLVLWRFWWCVILLCMATRVQWLKEIGSYNPNSTWEPIVYTAFLVMLTYVPFAALDFKPGDLVDSLLQKATIKQ